MTDYIGIEAPIWLLKWGNDDYDIRADGRTLSDDGCVRFTRDLLVNLKLKLNRSRRISEMSNLSEPSGSSTPTKKRGSTVLSASIDEDARYASGGL